jgi:hypothetical protein
MMLWQLISLCTKGFINESEYESVGDYDELAHFEIISWSLLDGVWKIAKTFYRMKRDPLWFLETGCTTGSVISF